MVDEPQAAVNASTSDAAKRSLVDDVRTLVEDGRTLVEAELAYQKSRAAVVGAGAKGVAGWGALALALAFFALMALVVGLIVALGSSIGPWWAMLAVFAGLLVCTGLSALVASRRWKRTARLLSDSEQTP